MKLRGILLLICLACLSLGKAQTNGDENTVVCYSASQTGCRRVAKWSFSGCERAHFRGRNGRYRVLISAILRCDMGSFVFSGRRKRLLRMIKRCGVIATFMR